MRFASHSTWEIETTVDVREKENTNHLIVVHVFVETRDDWKKPRIYTHIRDGQSHFMNGNNLIWLLLSPFSWHSEAIWHLHPLNLVSKWNPKKSTVYMENQRYFWRASMIQPAISAWRKTDCIAHHLTCTCSKSSYFVLKRLQIQTVKKCMPLKMEMKAYLNGVANFLHSKCSLALIQAHSRMNNNNNNKNTNPVRGREKKHGEKICRYHFKYQKCTLHNVRKQHPSKRTCCCDVDLCVRWKMPNVIHRHLCD